jgi:hypothetical protein
MFRSQRDVSATQFDPVAVARHNVDTLATALARAEQESVEARFAFDRAMRDYVAGSLEAELSQEPERAAVAKVESLRRLLAQAREILTRTTNEAEEASRLDAIRASGGQVSDLIAVAEVKLSELEAAIAIARRVEAELYDALFDQRTGLRQSFGPAQRDADFARHRLRRKAIALAVNTGSRIDARFESNGEVHLGPLERQFRAAGN